MRNKEKIRSAMIGCALTRRHTRDSEFDAGGIEQSHTVRKFDSSVQIHCRVDPGGLRRHAASWRRTSDRILVVVASFAMAQVNSAGCLVPSIGPTLESPLGR